MGELIEVEGIKVPIGNHKNKTIIIGCDHRGFEYKRKIIDLFEEKNYVVKPSEKEITPVEEFNFRKYAVGRLGIEAMLKTGQCLIDVGTYSTERCDYPAISNEIGRIISLDRTYNTVGLGICGSAIGILIPAQKHWGVYAANQALPTPRRRKRRLHGPYAGPV